MNQEAPAVQRPDGPTQPGHVRTTDRPPPRHWLGRILVIVLAAVSCDSAPADPASSDASAIRQRALAAGLAPMPLEPPRPVDNPFLPDRVSLGHQLFFDPILSGPLDVACST
jgi:cytochrome c peroxidase